MNTIIASDREVDYTDRHRLAFRRLYGFWAARWPAQRAQLYLSVSSDGESGFRLWGHGRRHPVTDLDKARHPRV